MDSSTELLSADSSTHCLSDTLVGNNTSFIEVSRKKRKTLAQRNATLSEMNKRTPPVKSPTPESTPAITAEFIMDLMQQWGNETLALVHLAKSYKTLNITKRKTSTGRNIIQALDSRSAQALVDIKSLFGKEIRFIKLDPAKKTMTATIMKVPHPITPADVMDIVPQIKKAERMTVWDQENKCLIETRTIKIDWEGKILPVTINLGILGEYETNHFKRDPVRCYKCHKFNHTARTCHAKNDICGLCGGHHRTRICVGKRNANKAITVNGHNCKGSHSTVSGRCPYRQEVFQRMRKSKSPGRNTNIPVKSVWQTQPLTVRIPSHTIQRPQAVTFQNAPPLPSMEDFPEIMCTTGDRDSRIPGPTNKLKSSSQPISQRHISETTTPQKKRFASGD